MTGLICDYVASYRDNYITSDQFREAMSDPEVILQQDLAEFILDAFDRHLLGGMPPAGYYNRVTAQVKVPISWR